MRPRQALTSADPPWPEGYGLTRLDEVTSTMDVAAAAAGTLMSPTWFLAARQTWGRGRQGKAWQCPEGNFTATLLLRPSCPAPRAALRSFVAALALYDALVLLGVDQSDLALKWPNDVLYRDGKLAGILLESHGLPGQARVEWLSIGIGVNLVAAPPREPTAAFAPVALAPEHIVSPSGFLNLLAPSVAHWEARLRRHGFDPLRAAWLNRAARLGREMTARVGQTTLNGTFETIDGAGNLILRTAKGRQAIAAAEIYF